MISFNVLGVLYLPPQILHFSLHLGHLYEVSEARHTVREHTRVQRHHPHLILDGEGSLVFDEELGKGGGALDPRVVERSVPILILAVYLHPLLDQMLAQLILAIGSSDVESCG